MSRSRTRAKAAPPDATTDPLDDVTAVDHAADPDASADDGAADDEGLLTLDELAAATGLVPRTIRYYQAEKLLQKPARDAKDARVARYGTDHVERLRLIGELRDRGLKLPAIRTLLHESDANDRVADWLGLDASLRGAWGHDTARLLQRPELDELLADTPPGTRGHLEDAHLVVRQGDAWLVASPALVELTLGLIRDGVRLDLVLEAGTILERSLGKAATELIELFVTARGDGFGDDTDTATLVQALRPIAGDAARIIFARQLERAIDDLLADTKRLRKL